MSENFSFEERSQIREQVVQEFVQNQKSMAAISRETGLSSYMVKKLLVEANVETSRKPAPPRPHLFEKIETEEDAYWLGLLYADGNVGKKDNGIALDLKESDKYLVEQFRQYCGIEKELVPHIIRRNGKEYVSYVCRFYNKEVKENLIKLGCVPAKSLILTCPTKEQVPDHLFPAFVRGYCDGDGYVRWEEIRHKEFILLGTEEFLTVLAKRMGWNTAYIHPDGTCKNFKLEIWKMNEVYDILSLLYEGQELCLKRKQEVFLKAKTYMDKKASQ